MPRSRRWAIALCALLGALAVTLWWRSLSSEPPEGAAVATTGEHHGSVEREAVATDVPPLAPSATVFVEVVSEDGAPIVGALVELSAPFGKREERADESGHASFERVMAGRWRVRASAPGYLEKSADEVLGEGLEAASWTLALALAPAEGDASMLRGVVVSGGAPVAGAVVVVEGDIGAAAASTKTGADGRFVVDGAGARAVIAFHEDYGHARTALTAGTKELLVELPAPGFIEGAVTDARGAPLERFHVEAALAGLPPGVARAVVGVEDDGRDGRERHAAGLARLRKRWPTSVEGAAAFRLGPLPAGSVVVVASAPGRTPEQLEVEVPPGGTRAGVSFRLGGSLTIVGCVTDASTQQPIKGARVRTVRYSGPPAAGFAEGLTGDDGCYRLLTAPDERHSISVDARGYARVMQGGVWGRADDEVQRDFELAPVPRGGKRKGFQYVGIGAKLRVHDDGAVVEGVFDTGSAAGLIEQGDVILRVDGTWTEGLPLERIVELIVGEEETEVELLVQKPGGGAPERVVLPRQRVSSHG